MTDFPGFNFGSLSDIYASPTGLPPATGAPSTGTQGTNTFNIPTNLFPNSSSFNLAGNQGQSASTGGSQSLGQSGSFGLNQSLGQSMSDAFSNSMGQSMSDAFSQSMGQSQGTNQSQSGINWGSPFMQAISPSLTQSATQLQPTVDAMGRTLQDQYSNLMTQALGPQAFQGTLNDMSSRGMLNSGVTSDALAQTGTNIMQDIGNRGYQSMLAQQQAQMQVPGILGGLAGLGQEASSAGQNTSGNIAGSGQTSRSLNEAQSGQTSRSQQEATGVNMSEAINQAQSWANAQSNQGGFSLGGSQSSNPLAPYDLMSQFLMY